MLTHTLRSVGVGALVGALAWSMPGAALAETVTQDAVEQGRPGSLPELTAATTASSVSAQGLTCRHSGGLSRLENGDVYFLYDPTPASQQANTLREIRKIGWGWKNSYFAWIGSGGANVFYGLTWSGELKWFRYDPVTGKWRPGSGATVGRGFVPGKSIVNIALGANGDFYVVNSRGDLVIYRHAGMMVGSSRWAGGWVIGRGWGEDAVLIPNGDGTLYRQYKGNLYWFRHSDPTKGRVGWAKTQLIGTGWNFYDVLPAGGGLMYAVEDGTGKIITYQHSDPRGGAARWVNPSGVQKGTVRPDSFGLVIEPSLCSLT